MVKLTPRAARLRRRLGPSGTVTTDEVVAALLRDDDGLPAELVRSAGADPEAIATRIETAALTTRSIVSEERLLRHAEGYAAVLGHTFTGAGHIFLATLDDRSSAAAAVLREIGLTRESVYPLLVEKLGSS